jgi:hypothetical protein
MFARPGIPDGKEADCDETSRISRGSSIVVQPRSLDLWNTSRSSDAAAATSPDETRSAILWRFPADRSQIAFELHAGSQVRCYSFTALSS